MARTNLTARQLRVPGLTSKNLDLLYEKLKDHDSALDDLESAVGTGSSVIFKAAVGVDTDNSWDIGDATHRLKDVFLMRLRSGASVLKVLSAVADGAAAIAFEVDTGVALANASSRLISLKNNGAEKLAVLFDGTLLTDTWKTLTTVKARIVSTIADGAGAIGLEVDTTNALANAAARLQSWKTNTVEKAAVFADGYFQGPGLKALGATGVYLMGRVADGASAIGLTFENNVTLADAAAKLVSIINNGVEKMAVLFDGTLLTDKWQSLTATTLLLVSTMADGAAAIAADINTTTAWSNASALLLRLRTNSVEKLAVLANGVIRTQYGIVKTYNAVGNNGAGARTTTGTKVGDRVVAVIGFVTASGVITDYAAGSKFESTVTVADQIQQSDGGNLSANTYLFIVQPQS